MWMWSKENTRKKNYENANKTCIKHSYPMAKISQRNNEDEEGGGQENLLYARIEYVSKRK